MGHDPRVIQELLDKQAIREILERYCRGVDRLDAELIRSCYHSDAEDDHGGFKGNGWEFADYVVKALGEHALATTHMLAQSVIEIDGPVAWAETYVLANHSVKRAEGEGELWLETFAGRYVDQLERRAGDWKIRTRQVVHDWSRVRKVEQTYPHDAFEQGGRGEHSDPSYTRNVAKGAGSS